MASNWTEVRDWKYFNPELNPDEHPVSAFWYNFRDYTLLDVGFWFYFIVITSIWFLWVYHYKTNDRYKANINLWKLKGKSYFPEKAASKSLSFMHSLTTVSRTFNLYWTLDNNDIVHAVDHTNNWAQDDVMRMNQAYFVLDFIHILTFDRDPVFIAHHLIGFFGAVHVRAMGRGGNGWMLMCHLGEFTTWILQLSWFFHQYHSINKKSKFAKLMSNMLLVTFGILFISFRGFEFTHTLLPATIYTLYCNDTENCKARLYPKFYVYGGPVISMLFILIGYVWIGQLVKKALRLGGGSKKVHPNKKNTKKDM